MRFLSSKAHTIIGLLVGVVLLLAPYIFGFSDNPAASAVPLYVGIFIILSELVTTSSASPLKLIPMRIHLVLDYLTGIFLALSPWLFGFASAPANAWVPHVIVGILVVGYALVTNPAVDSTEPALK
ncbi:MAG TPA: SPW repeat protein [Candidatus Saccharimonadales bacterium]|nr:SPW repeat protein [Candidatus Saccharimonadales bacterium]